MAQYLANTTNENQAQSVTSAGSINNTEPLRFGYPKENNNETDRRFAARFQPNIDLTRSKIRVDSAYLRVTQTSDQGTGAFISNIHVHDGDAPDLTTDDLAFGVVDVPSGTVSWSIASSWSTDTEYTTPDLQALVQDWFDRAGYATDDYIGIVVDGGDSASDEFKSVYDGDSSTVSYRPELEINYTLLFAGDFNSVTNENIGNIAGVSLQTIVRVNGSRGDGN